MNGFSIGILVSLGIAFWIGLYGAAGAFAVSRINQWANVRRLTVVSAKRRLLFAGPYFGWSPVYYITLQNTLGHESKAYAMLRGWAVDVHWIFESKEVA